MFNPMPFTRKVSLRGTQVLARCPKYWRSTPCFLVHNYFYIIDQLEEGANGNRINVGRKASELSQIPRRSKTSEWD